MVVPLLEKTRHQCWLWLSYDWLMVYLMTHTVKPPQQPPLYQGHCLFLACCPYILSYFNLSTMEEAQWPHLVYIHVVCSLLDQALQVRALAGGIHFTLIAPLSIQVYKWVLVNLMRGVTLRSGLASPSERSRNTSSCFMVLKPEINASLMGHLAHMQSLPTLQWPSLHLFTSSPLHLFTSCLGWSLFWFGLCFIDIFWLCYVFTCWNEHY